VTASHFYMSAGTDTVWLTADDVMNSFHTYAYDGNANRTTYERFNGYGSDSTWYTSDDKREPDRVLRPSLLTCSRKLLTDLRRRTAPPSGPDGRCRAGPATDARRLL